MWKQRGTSPLERASMQQLLKRKLDPLCWQEAMLYSPVYIDSFPKVEWITVMTVECTCTEMDYIS